MSHETPSKNSVIDLTSFRKKKETETQLARGRKPLYVSHATGKVSGSKNASANGESNDQFADRLARIKASLEKINSLMHELKKMSNTKQ